MTLSPYDHMQNAVDIVGTSPHPANKIAATLAGTDAKGQPYAVSATNYWPEPIMAHMGIDARIGNSSGTVHAETACILRAPMTDGSSLFITDLPCPNCVKNMAEAGIKAMYIDHKGFDKDFAKRRGHHFENMAMLICERAGISVYRIFRKEKKIETIYEPPAGYKPALEKPQHIEMLEKSASADLLSYWAKTERMRYGEEPYALAFAADANGALAMLSAQPHPVIGFTSDMADEAQDKYSFLLQPVNRVLMTAARKGLKIMPGMVYSSIVPTARELVNFIGAGLDILTIGDPHAARDQFGPMALAQIESKGILKILR